MIGKYVDLVDSYKSLNEALYHAGIINNRLVDITYFDSEKLTKNNINLLAKMNEYTSVSSFENRFNRYKS